LKVRLRLVPSQGTSGSNPSRSSGESATNRVAEVGHELDAGSTPDARDAASWFALHLGEGEFEGLS
jgi:hypothetical protein